MDLQKTIYKLTHSSRDITEKTWNKIKMTFHGAALFHHLYVAAVAQFGINHEDFRSVPMLKELVDFKIFFFTGWNFTIQVLFLLLALICDYYKSKELNKEKNNISKKQVSKLIHLRDFIYSTFIFPFSVGVFILFWTTYHIDREMVMPRAWDVVIPSHINHGIHTSILPVVAFEAILQVRRVPESHFVRLTSISALTLSYFVVFLSTYFITGIWIYVLFNHLTWFQTFLLLSFIYVSLHILYFVQWFINDLVKSYGKLIVQKVD